MMMVVTTMLMMAVLVMVFLVLIVMFVVNMVVMAVFVMVHLVEHQETGVAHGWRSCGILGHQDCLIGLCDDLDILNIDSLDI